MMKLENFDYQLPDNLIANYPLKNRSSSKLMMIDTLNNAQKHCAFNNIIDYIQPNDLLILNNTKVMPAKIYLQKDTGGKVEMLVTTIINEHNAYVMLKSNRSLKLPCKLQIEHYDIQVTKKIKDNFLIHSPQLSIVELMQKFGSMPLPPYMKRPSTTEDNARYQTVYAKHQGAIAAPTAGLHFTEELLSKLIQKKVQIAYVTLHVGAGTFKPVTVDDISQHDMHTEYCEVPQNVIDAFYQAKHANNKVFAVGTTTLRSLESAWKNNRLNSFNGHTNLFITPGYKFNTADSLITNFHLPKSTLLMLICAFGGYDRMMQCYQDAITNNYRFYSYGDAMLINRS